ncbi:MAG: hypothetical protein PHX10_01715, partial [Gallionellaceae bacterium]|nr:hypothetical protein [Gallionellaceae bacterium]
VHRTARPVAAGSTGGPRSAGTPATATAPAARFASLAGNLFPNQTWQPPPPKAKPVVAPPPPPPAPPGFPFAYSGRWLEGGDERVFLSQGETLLRAGVGDVVAGQWRLDKLEEGSLVFTYLPLDMQKTLRTK